MSQPECNIDWALIDLPPSRVGDNTITTFGQAPREFPIPDGAKLLNWDVKPLASKQALYKSGRVTGYTMGVYSGVKTAHIKHELLNGEMVPRHTWEHTVTNPHESFSRSGDSGSLVFDIFHNVVGLIYGGNERSNISYFTHVTDLLGSVEQVTGAAGVRIME